MDLDLSSEIAIERERNAEIERERRRDREREREREEVGEDGKERVVRLGNKLSNALSPKNNIFVPQLLLLSRDLPTASHIL